MPIAPATNHLAPPRRAHPRHIVGALLLAIGLAAVAITITIEHHLHRQPPHRSSGHDQPAVAPDGRANRRLGHEPSRRDVPRPDHPPAAYEPTPPPPPTRRARPRPPINPN